MISRFKTIKVVLIYLFVFGCSNEVNQTNSNLTELEQSGSETILVNIDLNSTSSVNLMNDSVQLATACQCEWDGWEQNGMLCIGMVCNEYCSQEVLDCNQSKVSCVVGLMR